MGVSPFNDKILIAIHQIPVETNCVIILHIRLEVFFMDPTSTLMSGRSTCPKLHWLALTILQLLALLAAALLISDLANAQVPRPTGGAQIDHSLTGFPLTGAHTVARCETCHQRGVFLGTPKDCNSCHQAGSRFSSSTKDSNHLPTTQQCDSCHQSKA